MTAWGHGVMRDSRAASAAYYPLAAGQQREQLGHDGAHEIGEHGDHGDAEPDGQQGLVGASLDEGGGDGGEEETCA